MIARLSDAARVRSTRSAAGRGSRGGFGSGPVGSASCGMRLPSAAGRRAPGVLALRTLSLLEAYPMCRGSGPQEIEQPAGSVNVSLSILTRININADQRGGGHGPARGYEYAAQA